MLASKIDEILEFLALDGGFHSIEEISDALNIPSNVCKTIASFLAKYDFVQYKDLGVKIDPKIRNLIAIPSDKALIQVTPTE